MGPPFFAPPWAQPRIQFGFFGLPLCLEGEGSGRRAVKYLPGCRPAGTGALNHSASSGFAGPRQFRKTTKSPGPAPSGMRTMSAGGVTSNESPGTWPSGTLTVTSTPSARSNFTSAPGLAPGGTWTLKSGCGASLYRSVMPGFASTGGSTLMGPCGPCTEKACPGTKLSESVAVNSQGGVARASGSKCGPAPRPPAPPSFTRSASTANGSLLRCWTRLSSLLMSGSSTSPLSLTKPASSSLSPAFCARGLRSINGMTAGRRPTRGGMA
mmetsp:Transcript_71793/g.162924  ORF Transcript_71793/g.162924 Transcript_71793/m.162924 type:complete len:268 (+) Transcript_71793:134-937(+)